MATDCITIQRNIERLISRCQNIIDGKLNLRGREWRLGRYITALREQTLVLEKYPSIEPDLINSLKQKVEVLQQLIIVDAQLPSKSNEVCTSHSKNTVSAPMQHLITCTSGGDELMLKMHSKQQAFIKESLFAKSGSSAVSSTSSKVTVGSVLENHQKMQEEIAEDMTMMAKSLRSNFLLAKEIILKDSKILAKTNETADENAAGIDRNVIKLRENNSQWCSWWIWIMLAVVFCVFFAMVLFIRIFPKP